MLNQCYGSRTIFHTPTPELIEYALKLPQYILEIKNKKPIFKYNSRNELIDVDEGEMLFCKGVFVKKGNVLFSYNFNYDLNPDRNSFINDQERFSAPRLIAGIRDYTVIKEVLSRMIDFYEKFQQEGKTNLELPYEFKATPNLLEKVKEDREGEYIAFLWKKAFEEIFKERDKKDSFKGTVIKTDFEISEMLQHELEKYRCISLPKEWTQFLELAGVKTDKDVIPEYIEENIPTSLTSNYGSQLWDTQRIVLDACQNHLPADCGGTTTFIRFQTKDGDWHDYREFKKFEDKDIKKIKISDDGIGYDSKSLGLFASIKGHEESTGKWGEGLKMIAASAVRNGIKLELRSRDWMATPFLTDEILNQGEANEEEVQRLNFLVKTITNNENNILSDNDNSKDEKYGFDKKKEQSSTTFVDPTPELIGYFRDIKNNILTFSDRQPMISIEDIDVLSMVDGRLYIKNILIPGDHQIRYTYHLKNFDIETRDRDKIKKRSMKQKIGTVLENVDNEQFIKMFLMEAAMLTKEADNSKFLEFDTFFYIPTKTEKADLWIRCFQEYFGEKACVRNLSSQDYSEVSKAQHMGIDTITLPDNIANAISGIEGRDGKKIMTYRDALNEAIENAVMLREDEVDEKAKAIIEQLYSYNDVLALNPISRNKITKINVFGYNPEYTGQRAAGFASYGNTLNINIKVLREGLEPALDVFFHEAGHAETGANDVDPGFRNFQTRTLAALASRILPLSKSIIDNGFVGKTRWSKFKESCKNILKKLFWKMATKNDSLDFGENEKGDGR